MAAKQILASQLRGKIILERNNHQVVGLIQEFIFSPQTCNLAYYQIKTYFSNQPYYLRADQVAPIGSLLTIQNPDFIGTIDDFIRDHDLLEKPCYLTGYKALNQANRRIGKIHDIGISPLLNTIERVYIRPPMWKRLKQTEIVAVRNNILEINKLAKTITILQGESRVQDRAVEAIPA